TQAPHWDVSQPTWVPVRRRFSRRNCTSRVRVSTSAVTGLPFTVMETAGMIAPPPQNFGPKGPFSGRAGLLATVKGEIVSFSPGRALGWANLNRGPGRGQGNWLRRNGGIRANCPVALGLYRGRLERRPAPTRSLAVQTARRISRRTGR